MQSRIRNIISLLKWVQIIRPSGPHNVLAIVTTRSCVTRQPVLTFYGHIITAEQRTTVQQYGDWYTGR